MHAAAANDDAEMKQRKAAAEMERKEKAAMEKAAKKVEEAIEEPPAFAQKLVDARFVRFRVEKEQPHVLRMHKQGLSIDSNYALVQELTHVQATLLGPLGSQAGKSIQLAPVVRQVKRRLLEAEGWAVAVTPVRLGHARHAVRHGRSRS